MKARRIYVYVSARGASAVARTLSGLDWLADFSPDELGWGDFGAVLRRFGCPPLHFLVDAADEEYRWETTPRMFGPARGEMLERRLRQSFRDTPYRAALSLGRERGGRRDEKFLFAALGSPELIRPWMDAAQLREAPVIGITPLPTLSHHLLPADPEQPYQLLVSRQTGGLRLSFLLDRQLRFSRLTPPDMTLDLDATQDVAAQILKTRLYLQSQRWLPRESRLAVHLLGLDEVLPEVLASRLSAEANADLTRLDLNAIATRLRIPEAWLRASREAPHLAVLASRGDNLNLAPPALTRSYTLRRIANVMRVLAAATFAAGLSWSGINLARAVTADAQTERLVAQTRRAHSDLLSARTASGGLPASPEAMREAVDEAQRLHDLRRDPREALLAVSGKLDTHPSIDLVRVRWRMPESAGQAEALSIEARVHPAPSRLRDMLGAIESFAAEVRRDARFRSVTFSHMPAAFDPAQGLSGGGMAQDTAFTLNMEFLP